VTRRPFDPSAAAGGLFEQPGSPAQPRSAISVAQAARAVQDQLGSLGRLRVQGEVSAPRKGKHCYFDLKDEHAVIACAIWASVLGRGVPAPDHGERVVIEGQFDFYAGNGKVTFVVHRLERVGEGDLDARFRALCAELRTAGYFDESRKRPLPMLPRGIAIVTSLDSAALHDCLKTSAIRFPAVPITVIGVPVQGAGSAEAVARAVQEVGVRAESLGVDVIVVTRGGGSREDLQAFNERVVADAVFRSAIPVVAAVGHESDTTVIDLVADHRASTPTQAMMAVLPDREELRQQLQGVAGTLELRVRQVLRRASDRLDAVRSRPCLRDASGGIRMPRERLRMVAARLAAQAPMARLAAAREGVAGLVRRIGLAAARQRSDRASRLRALSDRLASVSPTQVLARGYSITLSEAGRTVRSAADVAPGQVLRTRLHAGEIRSRVEPGG
jgi:exodeoxyribonuclease VII large subunit